MLEVVREARELGAQHICIICIICIICMATIWPTNLETVHHFGDAAACFGLPSRLYNVLLSEALMPVPPGPAQPGSAPVFGRYAGVQGVQMCPSAARRGF